VIVLHAKKMYRKDMNENSAAKNIENDGDGKRVGMPF